MLRGERDAQHVGDGASETSVPDLQRLPQGQLLVAEQVCGAGVDEHLEGAGWRVTIGERGNQLDTDTTSTSTQDTKRNTNSE